MTTVVGKPKKLKPQLQKESYVLLLSFNKNNNHSNNSNNNKKNGPCCVQVSRRQETSAGWLQFCPQRCSDS